MTLPAPFHARGEHIEIGLPGARVVFTTRRGGFSRGPYESLNLGRLTDDDDAAVERNRRRVEETLGVRLAFGRQVHGTYVRRVLEAPPDEAPPLEADGHATSSPDLAPMVLVADCLPIALAGDGAVAMLHCGWRGLAGGIIAEGVRAVRELGGDGPLSAAIGPGAGGCCYEVGDEVREALAGSGGVQPGDGRTVDLKAVARAQLEAAGVHAVHDVGLCTMCSDRSLFYSHRRDGGVTGRQAGVAWVS